MEGFWTVQFTGVQGWGAGVVTLVAGHLFGGDSGYIYTGTYTTQGANLNARVHVQKFVEGMANVMGRDNFDLQLTGSLTGKVAAVKGSIPGTQLSLSGTMTKFADLPK